MDGVDFCYVCTCTATNAHVYTPTHMQTHTHRHMHTHRDAHTLQKRVINVLIKWPEIIKTRVYT